MRRAAGGFAATVATAAAASPAAACTLCHSSVGDAVRAAMTGSAFWPDLAVLSAPVPVLVAAVLLLRRTLP